MTCVAHVYTNAETETEAKVPSLSLPPPTVLRQSPLLNPNLAILAG